MILFIRRCSLPNKPSVSDKSAFTLIELLTVMAIIVILAGLVVGAAGIIQNKAARARSMAEIVSFGTAITNYESDNGSAPRNSSTDSLNARASDDPSSSGYAASSAVLYKLLSGNYFISQGNVLTQWKTGNAEHPDRPKSYYDFKPNQVTGATITNGKIADPTTVTAIIDPFGLSYGYSTAYVAALEKAASSNNPNTVPTVGFNPTYDLWSTASYGSGKPYPTTVATADRPNLWIKNWN